MPHPPDTPVLHRSARFSGSWKAPRRRVSILKTIDSSSSPSRRVMGPPVAGRAIAGRPRRAGSVRMRIDGCPRQRHARKRELLQAERWRSRRRSMCRCSPIVCNSSSDHKLEHGCQRSRSIWSADKRWIISAQHMHLDRGSPSSAFVGRRTRYGCRTRTAVSRPVSLVVGHRSPPRSCSAAAPAYTRTRHPAPRSYGGLRLLSQLCSPHRGQGVCGSAAWIIVNLPGGIAPGPRPSVMPQHNDERGDDSITPGARWSTPWDPRHARRASCSAVSRSGVASGYMALPPPSWRSVPAFPASRPISCAAGHAAGNRPFRQGLALRLVDAGNMMMSSQRHAGSLPCAFSSMPVAVSSPSRSRSNSPGAAWLISVYHRPCSAPWAEPVGLAYPGRRHVPGHASDCSNE